MALKPLDWSNAPVIYIYSLLLPPSTLSVRVFFRFMFSVWRATLKVGIFRYVAGRLLTACFGFPAQLDYESALYSIPIHLCLINTSLLINMYV